MEKGALTGTKCNAEVDGTQKPPKKKKKLRKIQS
jgi:hypothetical protein